MLILSSYWRSACLLSTQTYYLGRIVLSFTLASILLILLEIVLIFIITISTVVTWVVQQRSVNVPCSWLLSLDLRQVLRGNDLYCHRWLLLLLNYVSLSRIIPSLATLFGVSGHGCKRKLFVLSLRKLEFEQVLGKLYGLEQLKLTLS